MRATRGERGEPGHHRARRPHDSRSRSDSRIRSRSRPRRRERVEGPDAQWAQDLLSHIDKRVDGIRVSLANVEGRLSTVEKALRIAGRVLPDSSTGSTNSQGSDLADIEARLKHVEDEMQGWDKWWDRWRHFFSSMKFFAKKYVKTEPPLSNYQTTTEQGVTAAPSYATSEPMRM